jgi:hypothetical protein
VSDWHGTGSDSSYADYPDPIRIDSDNSQNYGSCSC